jgi:hypothetical protein
LPAALSATNRRPKTIAIVAGFLFAAATVAVIVGISLLFRNPILHRMWELNPAAAPVFHAHGGISGLLLLGLGVATFTAAHSLLRGQEWAWWFAVALFAVNGLGNVISLFATREPVRSVSGIAIASAFLYFLTRARVRRYFIPPDS